MNGSNQIQKRISSRSHTVFGIPWEQWLFKVAQDDHGYKYLHPHGLHNERNNTSKQFGSDCFLFRRIYLDLDYLYNFKWFRTSLWITLRHTSNTGSYCFAKIPKMYLYIQFTSFSNWNAVEHLLFTQIYDCSGLFVVTCLNKSIQNKPQNTSTLHCILMFTLSAAYDFSDIVNLLRCKKQCNMILRKCWHRHVLPMNLICWIT